MGALANVYFWMRKYCNEDDIVVNIDGDDRLIGSQVLQILNSVYKNSNYWYVYSKFLINKNK